MPRFGPYVLYRCDTENEQHFIDVFQLYVAMGLSQP